MRDCPTCHEETLADHERPEFKDQVRLAPLKVMFSDLFEALETEERTKDARHYIFECLVGQMFKDPSKFWDYVNDFEREW